MADTKKEYTSNLHPKGDMDTTVYPNVKSENIIDKDTTAYTAGKVPDSSLVSKSLDSLSENFEMTKIQVNTNKTNIATLQGDVSSLKQDNQTTKTTIAGLVSADTTNKANIAKNTQDIENLSAVMPTDINVDSDYNLILEHDGTEITGQKKKLRIPYYYFSSNHEINGYIFKDTYMFLMKARDKELTFYLVKDLNTSPEICLDIKSSRLSTEFTFRNTYHTSTSYRVTFHLDGSILKIYTFGPNAYEYNFPKKDGTIALTSDLDAKQSTLYRHTVKISKPTDDGNTSITFTTSSEKNTPINSIQNLTTVFGNTDLSVSGATYLISSSQWEFYNKIHVGTSINDTTVDYINKDDVGTYNFIDMFGTTGFTITDNVTSM